MMMIIVFLMSLLVFTEASSYGSYGDKSEKYVGYGDDISKSSVYVKSEYNYGEKSQVVETPSYGQPSRPPMACIKRNEL